MIISAKSVFSLITAWFSASCKSCAIYLALGGFAMVLSMGAYAQPVNEGVNPFMADPSVFYHKGVYYLYGTGGGNKDDGFKVFTSADRKTWKDQGYVLKKGESFGTKGFWAPQVFQHKGMFYLAYTANEHIAIAVSDRPLGPFRQEKIAAIPSDTRMIDPFVFFNGGKIYLYHVRLQEGNRIFVAEINDDLSAIKENTLRECISASEKWEDTQNVPWKVAEGPTVLKRKGWYYLIYSANDFRNPDYAIGYAVSKTPVGPWKKYDGNPVVSRQTAGVNGTGHGDVFKDAKGKMFYVLHTHFSNEKVAPRKTALVKISFRKKKNAPDIIVAHPETFVFLKIKK